MRGKALVKYVGASAKKIKCGGQGSVKFSSPPLLRISNGIALRAIPFDWGVNIVLDLREFYSPFGLPSLKRDCTRFPDKIIGLHANLLVLFLFIQKKRRL